AAGMTLLLGRLRGLRGLCCRRIRDDLVHARPGFHRGELRLVPLEGRPLPGAVPVAAQDLIEVAEWAPWKLDACVDTKLLRRQVVVQLGAVADVRPGRVVGSPVGLFELDRARMVRGHLSLSGKRQVIEYDLIHLRAGCVSRPDDKGAATHRPRAREGA